MPLEISKAISTRSIGNGHCPFRGLPHYPLDERCPSTVPVIEGSTDPEPCNYDVFPVPVVRLDSPCAVCLQNRTRERDAGESVSSQTFTHNPRRMAIARRRRSR
jgi:hypothetical protein